MSAEDDGREHDEREKAFATEPGGPSFRLPLPAAQAPPWERPLESLQTHFLQPDEGNLGALPRLVEALLNRIERPDPGAPRLGARIDHEQALAPFEALPEDGLDTGVVLAALGGMLAGLPKWQHPRVMHNVHPAPMLETVAAGAVASLYNANALWDHVSAGATAAERQVVRQLAALAGWDAGRAGGVFTFGGKGCLTYALRLGLNRAVKGSAKTGLAHGAAPVVVSSAAGHDSIDSACALLGIGSDNSLRTAVQADGRMDLDSLAEVLGAALREGRPVAAVVLSGGDTLHLSIDPVRDALAVVERLCAAHALGYRPYVYFDLVVGWPWLAFAGYDFTANPLALPAPVAARLEATCRQVAQVAGVDGFGVDFHKLGHCPYATSLFLSREAAELHAIFGREPAPLAPRPQGANFLQHHTIEHSRSAAPILAAWAALQLTGRSGTQARLANGLLVADELRRVLGAGGFELLNPYGNGFASVFAVRPPGPADDQTLRQASDPASAPARGTAPHHAADYAAVLAAPAETVQAHNAYTYALACFVDEGGAGPGFVLRFLPQYRRADCGLDAAVLVVHPMAPSLGPAQAGDLGRALVALKRAFDARRASLAAPGVPMPRHVPQ